MQTLRISVAVLVMLALLAQYIDALLSFPLARLAIQRRSVQRAYRGVQRPVPGRGS